MLQSKIEHFCDAFFLSSCLLALKGPSKKLPGRIIHSLIKKEKKKWYFSSVLGGGEEMYFYQFQQLYLIAPAGSLRHPSRTINQLEIWACDIEIYLYTKKILSTSESNEVSLLRNFPFFVNMSRNMSVVDWLVSPDGACGASKCTCGSSNI